jgi:hypothetical protein
MSVLQSTDHEKRLADARSERYAVGGNLDGVEVRMAEDDFDIRRIHALFS